MFHHLNISVNICSTNLSIVKMLLSLQNVHTTSAMMLLLVHSIVSLIKVLCVQVCGNKWADTSEHDFGLAVLNDCKYGWSCIDNVLRLSL